MNLLMLSFFFIVSVYADASKLVFKTTAIDKHNRQWWEHVPTSCSKKECPIVLAFHNSETSGDRLEDDMKMINLSNEHEFILIFPNAINKQWGDGREETSSNTEDVKFVDKLLDELRKRLKIDGNKIYATGLSDGGLFTFKLACERSELFAAIAPVAANMATDLLEKCNPARAVPIINFVGTDDKIMPMEGGEVKSSFGFRKKGKILSTNQTLGFWLKKNKCNSKPNVDKVRDTEKNDKTYAVLEKYEGCENGADIFRWVIGEGGHTWPSGSSQQKKTLGKVTREVNATEEIWNFFSSHPMKDAPPAADSAPTPTTPPPTNPVLK